MNVQEEDRQDHIYFKLQGPLTIDQTEAAKSYFLNNTNTGKRWVIDLQQVEACDTIGIQLLVSLNKTSLCNQQGVKFHNCSKAVIKALDRIGLSFESLCG